MIEFKDVTKHFGDTIALSGISFFIERGSFTYLVGETGSGKTTIFRHIVRDLLPTEGEITVGDWNVIKLPKRKIPELRRKVGVIFQDLKLLMDRTVEENVMLPLEFAGISEKQAREIAREILTEVGLSEKIEKFPLQLSGGEKQRVAIARVLGFNPEVILADEPTGNLDQDTSFQIVDLLESINKKSTTIIMATHNEEILRKRDKRVISLKSGMIINDRKPSKTEKSENKEGGKHASS